MERVSYQRALKSVNDFLPRQEAVLLIRHVFHGILKPPPDQQELVRAALASINLLFSALLDSHSFEGTMDTITGLPPSDLANGLPMPRDFSRSKYAYLFTDLPICRSRDHGTDPATGVFERNFTGPEWTSNANL